MLPKAIYSHAPWRALSVVLGSAYYFMMARSIPKESNCSFLATVWTDILATLVGAILMCRGVEGGDKVVSTLGMAIIVEHFWQWYFNKKDETSQ